MTDALEDHEGTVSTGGSTITNLRFADNIDGLAEEEEELANLVERLDVLVPLYPLQAHRVCVTFIQLCFCCRGVFNMRQPLARCTSFSF